MKQIITINIGRLWNLKIRVAGTMPNYYTSYSLSMLSLAKILELMLEISATYRLVKYKVARALHIFKSNVKSVLCDGVLLSCILKQCIIKQLLDSVFVISAIILVPVSAIHLNLRLG